MGTEMKMNAVTGMMIQDYLDDHDIPHSCKGYHMLFTAISLLCSDRNLRESRATMQVYYAVAEQCRVKVATVDRNMRHAISKLPEHIKLGDFIFRACDTLMIRAADAKSVPAAG